MFPLHRFCSKFLSQNWSFLLPGCFSLACTTSPTEELHPKDLPSFWHLEFYRLFIKTRTSFKFLLKIHLFSKCLAWIRLMNNNNRKSAVPLSISVFLSVSLSVKWYMKLLFILYDYKSFTEWRMPYSCHYGKLQCPFAYVKAHITITGFIITVRTVIPSIHIYVSKYRSNQFPDRGSHALRKFA